MYDNKIFVWLVIFNVPWSKYDMTFIEIFNMQDPMSDSVCPLNVKFMLNEPRCLTP